MVLICAGMSSGPSVSWLHPASSGASRSSTVIRSASTDGSAFSWIVSDAEVWRMNSVPAPSCAPGSLTNLATSVVRSTKPAPEVWTVSSDETMVLALTEDNALRESDLGEGMNSVSPSSLRKQCESRDDPQREYGNSNLAADVLLHPVGHFNQPAPGLFQKRHHAIHVAVARQWNFDFALAFGDLWLRLFQRVRLWQGFVDLAADTS